MNLERSFNFFLVPVYLMGIQLADTYFFLLNKDSEMSQIDQNVEFVQVNTYVDRELIAIEG